MRPAGMGGKRSAVSDAQLEQMRQELQQPGQAVMPRNLMPTHCALPVHMTENELCKVKICAL